MEMFKRGEIDAATAMDLLAGNATSSHVRAKVAEKDNKSNKRPCPEPETSPTDPHADVDEAVDEAVGGTFLDS